MLSDGDRALSCPKCDAPMVRRVAKRGKNAGNEFWGCSTFPKCRSICLSTTLQRTARLRMSKTMVCVPVQQPAP